MSTQIDRFHNPFVNCIKLYNFMISCVNEFCQLNIHSVNTKKASFVDFILYTLKKWHYLQKLKKRA